MLHKWLTCNRYPSRTLINLQTSLTAWRYIWERWTEFLTVLSKPTSEHVHDKAIFLASRCPVSKRGRSKECHRIMTQTRTQYCVHADGWGPNDSLTSSTKIVWRMASISTPLTFNFIFANVTTKNCFRYHRHLTVLSTTMDKMGLGCGFKFPRPWSFQVTSGLPLLRTRDTRIRTRHFSLVTGFPRVRYSHRQYCHFSGAVI
jgi:hypothetical protein